MVEALAVIYIVSLEKYMLASLEGDDVANRDLGPGMYCRVVLLELYLFLTWKYQICTAENGGS